MTTLLERVFQGDVGIDIQTETRPLIAKLKETNALEELQDALRKKGFSERESKVLSGAHHYYTRWKYVMPSWHPIFILKNEHIGFMNIGAEAVRTMFGVYDAPDITASGTALQRIAGLMKDWALLEGHMIREENVLFPVLERYGFENATSDKWDDHQDIRQAFKHVNDLLEMANEMRFNEFRVELRKVLVRLNKLTGNHYSAEDVDLFNNALEIVKKDDWDSIRQGFDELGYPDFMPAPTPPPARVNPVSINVVLPERNEEGMIKIGHGLMSLEQIEAIFNTLPVDITFVDKDDRVKYFNDVPDRLFPRTKSVIGREVRMCHPKKSIHMVDRIVNDFKSGARDSADFWIRIKGRFVYIRYFAVRNAKNEYLGTLEVTQDVTGIRGLKGEKRLLD